MRPHRGSIAAGSPSPPSSPGGASTTAFAAAFAISSIASLYAATRAF